jgi:hypothetical protein
VTTAGRPGPAGLGRLEPCASGRLRDSYPVNAHDVEARVAGQVPPPQLADWLRSAAREALTDDPRCRRVVFAAPAGGQAAIDAAKAAGFRYVADVDLPGEELSLFVTEPGWVTALDSERVPGTLLP